MVTGLVLVTGANGFLGKRVVIELLRAGYAVRGTVRSEGKAETVRLAVLADLGDDALARLEFVRADLLREPRWLEAMQGVDALVHSAALVSSDTAEAEDVIETALEGSGRVLRYAIAAGVQRVVLTASTATIGYGHRRTDQVFDEGCFTDLGAMRLAPADCIGKARAERNAWAYARAENLALTTVLPALMLGPALDRHVSASLGVIGGLLDGSMTRAPRIGHAVVDVRDVALMHVAALANPASAGQRYIAAAGYLSLGEMAAILQRVYPGVMLPQPVPDWLVRLRARFDGNERQFLADLGVERRYDGGKGAALLGRPYISAEAAVLAAAESLMQFGLVNGSAPGPMPHRAP